MVKTNLKIRKWSDYFIFALKTGFCLPHLKHQALSTAADMTLDELVSLSLPIWK